MHVYEDVGGVGCVWGVWGARRVWWRWCNARKREHSSVKQNMCVLCAFCVVCVVCRVCMCVRLCCMSPSCVVCCVLLCVCACDRVSVCNLMV